MTQPDEASTRFESPKIWILRALGSALRSYPWTRGRGRIVETALDLLAPVPEDIRIAKTRDGRQFCVRLSEKMHRSVYFFGDYERWETRLLTAIISSGDSVVDIGANFGYFTTLFSSLVGPSGHVLAFEPVPPIFAELNFHVVLNNGVANTELFPFGLGESEEERPIYVFRGLPHGHASFSNLGRDDYVEFTCRTRRLDDVAQELSMARLDVVKCDVEGAELSALRGAANILTAHLPSILVELNIETSSSQGHRPEDVITYLRARGPYRFFHIVEGRLVEFERPNHQILAKANNILACARDSHLDRAGRAIALGR